MSRQDPLPTVLFRDPDLLAIDKPPGLPSVRERWVDDDSAFVKVWDILRLEDPEARKPRVVHRLDKETSGVLLFATSLPAARALSRHFRDRTVAKTYQAIVLGTPPEDEGAIDIRIDEVPGGKGRMRVVAKKGKPSLTEWSVLERFRGFSLLEMRPRTGRTHQIRVSLLHIGYPLLVDPMYGGGESFLLSRIKRGYKTKPDQEERPLIGRVSLHAARIALPHPITGDPVEISAEMPSDFTMTLKYLRRYRAMPARRSG